jgi:hypothetical protein
MKANKLSSLAYLKPVSKLHPIAGRKKLGEKIWRTFTPLCKKEAKNG